MARTPHRTMSHKVCIASTPVVVRGHIAELARKEENAARAMKHASGIIRRGHNPKRPYRATAASRRYTAPKWRTGRPGAMAAAAPAWLRVALQRLEAVEPAPFLPQRLGLLHLLEAPKRVTAGPGVVAAACALPAAKLPGAEAERSQQIALRAPDQIGAHAPWPRQPLFEREPARDASRGSSPRHNLSFENGLMSFERNVLLRHSSIRCRDAAAHPSFAHAKKSQAKKHSKITPPLKEGRRSADRRVQDPHRKAMRRVSLLLPLMLRGPRPPGPHGVGALPFRRPTAASEVF